VRTLFSRNRALRVVAAIIAAALISGGAYFVGYASEIERASSNHAHRAAAEIATIEKALGYGGFLKSYRSYRLTGEADARANLSIKAAEAAHAVERLRSLYVGDAAAADALSQAAAVIDAFAHVARIAPQLGDAALRGTPEMEALNSLPPSQQLETTYLSLGNAFDRLRQRDMEQRLGGATLALSSNQSLIVGGVAVVAAGLIAVAILLLWGVVRPMKTLARKADATKTELEVKFDGAAAATLEKLTGGVATATEALNVAAADLLRLQNDGRRNFETAVRNLQQSRSGFDEAAKIANESAAAAIDELRASTTKLTQAADERAARLDEVTVRIDERGRALERAFISAKDKVEHAADGLAASNGSLNRLADDARSHFDKVSSNSADTTGKVDTLASQLAEAIDAVDERVGQKLNTLDTIEQHLSVTLARVQERADETLIALNTTANERAAAAEAQLMKATAAFERLLAEVRTHADTLAGLTAAATPTRGSAPEFETLSKVLHAESETIRNEIRELAIRLTEDRLLAGADMPLLGAKAGDDAPRKTLADVPHDEIRARLENLAAEMNAAQAQLDHVAALQATLIGFATELGEPSHDDRPARLKSIGLALNRHADEIETHGQANDPTRHAEVQAITSELRMIAARAQATNVKDAPALREAALRLGERARDLFDRFDEAPAPADIESTAAEPDAANTDLAALAQLIGRLEAKAEGLARAARATRFDAPSPDRSAELRTDDAVRTVFESIERLNGVAAALARAGDAERLRRAAH
jgi:hypothetical protein